MQKIKQHQYDIKFKVLQSCLVSTVLYSCETWRDSYPKELEIINRTGIRTAISIRRNVCNEILYIASGHYPLICEIKKRQYRLVEATLESQTQNLYIKDLIAEVTHLNIHYVQYYNNLWTEFESADQLKCVHEEHYRRNWELKIRNPNIEDENSKLGTYLIVNPLSKTCGAINVMETERITITRFRVGSHNLRIETGRYENIPRNQRTCLCETGIQTIKHFFMECPVLTYLRDQSHTSNNKTLFLGMSPFYLLNGPKP